MKLRVDAGFLLATWALGGCYVDPPFECSDDQGCAIDGLVGRCEATGYCAFPDEGCSSGWRYGRNGPPEIAGVCVVPLPADTSTDTDPGPGPGQTGSSTGTPSSGVGTNTPEPSTGSSTGLTTGSSESTDGPTTGSPDSCGNGVLDPDEACDEPNGRNADGCNEDCTISGSVLWSSTLGGTFGLTEDFFGIAVAEDGRSYATGTLFNSDLESDHWVQQFDPDGGAGWSLAFDGTAHGNDAGRTAHVVGDSLYVAGKLDMVGSGTDWSLRQFSLEGAAGWSEIYGGPQLGDDTPRGVAVDGAGRIYVAGRVETTTDSDVLVRQYLEDGLLGWQTTYDGVAHGADGARAAATDALGNVLVAGFETVAANQTDGWIAKYESSGVTSWTRSYQGAAGLGDIASGVAVDMEGAVYCDVPV